MFQKIIIKKSLKLSTYCAFLLYMLPISVSNDLTFHAHITFFCLSHAYYSNHDVT